MFTGLVEEIGTLRRISRQGEAMILTIESKRVLEDIQVGDSIAVNGVCLTVIAFDDVSFTADVMPETFRRSTLHQLAPGKRVNLERAMSAQSRFGGHIVQGHVDSTAVISSRRREDNAVVFRLEPEEPAIMKYIVPKGSITIDGISLTVVEAESDYFTVSIIPHTLAQTVLQHKEPGEAVNIECDILGKYVERLLSFREQSAGRAGRKPVLTESFLADHGFY